MHSRIVSRWNLTALAVATGLLGFCGVTAAQAADGPSPRKTVAPPRKAAPPRAKVKVISIPVQEECPADDNEAMNGMKAFIDPETGELRAPTREEEAALTRAIAGEARIRAQEANEVVVGADGSLTYLLGEDAMVDVIARTGSDGKPVFFCAPRAETPKALTRPLPAPKKNGADKEKE